VGGFIEILFLTVPGWFALRSYRRWRSGEQRKPLFAWVWAWITIGLVALGVAGAAINAAIPNQLLQANFNQGPGPFTIETTSTFSGDVVGGTYRIRILAQQGSADRSFANLVREAGAVSVHADIVELNAAGSNDIVGLECGRANGEGYLFGAGANEGYAILKFAGGQPTTLKTDETASMPGSGKIEQLRFTCVGDPFGGTTKLYASINGTTVATVEDPNGFDTFTTIGLALAGEQGTEVRFDNVLARVPTSQDY